YEQDVNDFAVDTNELVDEAVAEFDLPLSKSRFNRIFNKDSDDSISFATMMYPMSNANNTDNYCDYQQQLKSSASSKASLGLAAKTLSEKRAMMHRNNSFRAAIGAGGRDDLNEENE